jgi:class 3 adenylate cyclase
MSRLIGRDHPVSDANPYRMSRLTLRFADAAVEAAYADEHARKSVRPFRILLAANVVVTALVYVLVVFVTHAGIAARPGGSVERPLVMIVGTSALLYALSRQPLFLRRQQTILFVVFCLFSSGIISLASRMPADFLVTRGWLHMLLQTFTIYSIGRLRFPQATIAAWISAAGYLGAMAGTHLLDGSALGRHAVTLGLVNVWGMLICYQLDGSARREFAAMRLLAKEQERSERLLLNILPAPIAERLKASEESIADHADAVTVLFSDIVGFTPLSASKTPRALVELLNRIFSEFDALAEAHGLEKIKTIGDAYMAVAGLPNPQADHAARAARMALAMRDAIARVASETGEKLAVRIGLHSVPVVAGVIGRKKFSYDLWGDTVNTASRMESHGVPGAVHCSEDTAKLLEGAFVLQARGPVDVKGKGEMHTFLLAEAEPIPRG